MSPRSFFFNYIVQIESYSFEACVKNGPSLESEKALQNSFKIDSENLHFPGIDDLVCLSNILRYSLDKRNTQSSLKKLYQVLLFFGALAFFFIEKL